MILNNSNRARIISEIESLTLQYGVSADAVDIHLHQSGLETVYRNVLNYNGYAWKQKILWDKEYENYLFKEKRITPYIKSEESDVIPYNQYTIILDEEKQELIYCHNLELKKDIKILGQKWYRDLLKDYCPEFRGFYKKISFNCFKNEDILIKFCKIKWENINTIYMNLCKQIETNTFDDFKNYLKAKKKKKIDRKLFELSKDFN